jgi:hypothetical protein
MFGVSHFSLSSIYSLSGVFPDDHGDALTYRLQP